MIYGFTAIISSLIRNIVLPNPFENLGYALLANSLAAGVMHPLTFIIVGMFYKKRSYPALGSSLYLFFYILHTILLMFCSMFHYTTISFIIVFGLYAIALKRVYDINNDMNWRMD